MLKTKGNKNRPKLTTDFISQIAEKQESIASLTPERSDFLGSGKKSIADAKAAEETKKAEVEEVMKKLLTSGMSVDEILEKLK